MGQECSFEYDGPPELKPRIEQALGWVLHPLFGINVLEAGLVHGVHADAQRVHVRMFVTTSCCPLTDLLAEDVEAEVFDHLGGVHEVQVDLLRGPKWSPARMKLVPLNRLKTCPCKGADLTAVKVHRCPAA
jgi:metal-sulfur cluster biosynthetic enzyme